MPEQYIIESWANMVQKAEEALMGDCPLLEDETIVEMENYLVSLEWAKELKAKEKQAATLSWIDEDIDWDNYSQNKYIITWIDNSAVPMGCLFPVHNTVPFASIEAANNFIQSIEYYEDLETLYKP